MNKQNFNHNLLRKYAAVFGSLFNDVHVRRPSVDSRPEQLMKVPLRYGPKDKMISRLTESPDANRNYAALLPRMGFEQGDMRYDPDRVFPSVNRTAAKVSGSPNDLYYTYSPVPYDIDFTLYVMAKNTIDGNAIIEQILPFFTPQWTLSVNLVPEMDITRDIVVIFNGSPMKMDSYDGVFENRRVIVWSLSFTMKAWLYGPVRKAAIVKFSESVFHGIPRAESFEDAIERGDPGYEKVTVTPGMTANGTPTSNPLLSVDPNTIYVDDDFGYAAETEYIEDEA